MGTRLLKILAIACPLLLAGFPARAAGTGDPTYPQILARSHPVGVLVDWQIRLLSVRKSFFTYVMDARIVPDPGQSCDRCLLTVVYRGRPQDLARPAIFHPGELVAVRGVVMRVRPDLEVLAGAINRR